MKLPEGLGIKLTVGIPTYNRREYLADSLRSVLMQLGPYKDVVEVLVSDNHSELPAEDIVKALSAEYDYPVRYVYQPENIGMEPNFRYVIENARGEYIHVMSDDDIVMPFFYPTFMPYILSGTYGMLSTDNIAGAVGSSIVGYNPHAGMTAELIEVSAEEYIKKAMFRNGLISTVIFNKGVWDAAPAGIDYSRYYLYQTLAHELLGTLKFGKPCVVCTFPMVFLRTEVGISYSDEKYDSYILGILALYKDLDAELPGIYEYAFNKRYRGMPYYREFRSMGLQRGHYRHMLPKYLEYFKGDDGRWLKFWLKTPAVKFMVRHHNVVDRIGFHLLRLRRRFSSNKD